MIYYIFIIIKLKHPLPKTNSGYVPVNIFNIIELNHGGLSNDYNNDDDDGFKGVLAGRGFLGTLLITFNASTLKKILIYHGY